MLVDDLAKLNRSSRNAFYAALILIAAIAMYNWIVAPHTTYLFATQRCESVMDNIAEKNELISERIKIKKKKLQQLRKQFTHLESTLFTPKEAKEFFSDLQAISEEVGCIVYSLNFITREPHPDDEQSEHDHALCIVANSAMLEVVGVYSNVIKLVERLLARTHVVGIDSLRLEAIGDDSGQLKCDITITIYTISDKVTSL